MGNIFYVYEHWRPDTNVCFYVGKGKGKRAYDARTYNPHHDRVAKKLERFGLIIDVRFVALDLYESDAFRIEKERISFWRANGVALSNMTDGGEGHSNPSPEARAKIAATVKARCLGIKLSAEHRAKISAAALGRTLSDETKAKLRAAHLGSTIPDDVKTKVASSVKQLWQDDAYREKLLDAHKNRLPISDETRARMRVSQQARGTRSEETKAKTSAAIKAWHAARKLERPVTET